MKAYSFNINSSFSSTLPSLDGDSIIFNGIRIPCSEIVNFTHDSISSSGWINTVRRYLCIESKSTRLEIKNVSRRFFLSSERQDPASLKYDELFCRLYELAVPALTIRLAKCLLDGHQVKISPFLLTKDGIIHNSWSGKRFCSWEWSPHSQVGLKHGGISNPFILHQLVHTITHFSAQTLTRVKFGQIKCSSKNFSPLITLLWLVSPQPNEDKFLGLRPVIDFFRSNLSVIQSSAESPFKNSLLSRFTKRITGPGDFDVIYFG